MGGPNTEYQVLHVHTGASMHGHSKYTYKAHPCTEAQHSSAGSHRRTACTHTPVRPCTDTSDALTLLQSPRLHAQSTPSRAAAQPRTHLHAEPALVCPDQAVGHDAAGRPHPQAPALGQPGLGAQQESAGHVPPQQRDPGSPVEEAAVGQGRGMDGAGPGMGQGRGMGQGPGLGRAVGAEDQALAPTLSPGDAGEGPHALGEDALVFGQEGQASRPFAFPSCRRCGRPIIPSLPPNTLITVCPRASVSRPGTHRRRGAAGGAAPLPRSPGRLPSAAPCSE